MDQARPQTLECEKITDVILGAAIEVHRSLGPGLLESTYEACLAHELLRRGTEFGRQVELPVRYKSELIDCGYRVDLLVAGQVIVELKSVDKVLPVHEAQLMTYLRLSGLPVGLLINFNVSVLRNGITRRVITTQSLRDLGVLRGGSSVAAGEFA